MSAPSRWLIVTVTIVFAVAVLLYAGLLDDPEVAVDTQIAREPQHEAGQEIASQPEPAGIAQSEIDVSDEETITINWYERPHRSFVFPNGSPLENYEYYKVLAESGHGLAAYQLANMMSSCTEAFLTRAELNGAIVQLQETFTYYGPNIKANVRVGEQEDVDDFIDTVKRHFEECEHFTAGQREEHKQWMELAVNNGHTTAMLEYGQQLDDLVAAVALYRSAWRQGDGDALLSLAGGLEELYDQGIDPNAKIPAYAAMHAFVTLLRTAHGADPERVVGRWTLRNQAKLDEMAKLMLPRELEAAVESSRALITSNKNCCYAM